MTLRNRLLAAVGACLLVTIAAFFGVERRQEQVLLDQLDDFRFDLTNFLRLLLEVDQQRNAIFRESFSADQVGFDLTNPILRALQFRADRDDQGLERVAPG